MLPQLIWGCFIFGLASILLCVTFIPNPSHGYIRMRQSYNSFKLYIFGPSFTYLSSPGLRTPISFSPSTNCTKWLQQTIHTIIYPFGVQPFTTGALELAACIAREEALGTRARIKHIQVAFPSSGAPRDDLTPLLNIMDVLPNLETVSWSSWNRPVMDDLTHWAQIHKPTVITQIVDQEIRPLRKCPSSLRVSASYDTNHDELSVVDQVYDIVTACPKVKSLSLSITQGGCSIGSNPWSFNFHGYDTFHALEHLELSGYNWDDTTRNEEGSTAAWKNHMDWSKLRTLNIDLPPNSFLNAFKGEDILQSLDSLTLRPKWGFWGDETTLYNFDDEAHQLRANYTSFITSLRPLGELSVSGMGEHLDIISILERHGATLRKLSIHEFEGGCFNRTRPSLVHQLDRIHEHAPDLHTLELDFLRDRSDWPNPTMELARFEALRELHMHFDLEDRGQQVRNTKCEAREAGYEDPRECPLVAALAEPRLTLTNAKDMLLNLGRVGSKVNSLTVTTGDYGRREGGGLRFPDDSVPMPRKVVCWCNGEGECREENGVYCEGWDDDKSRLYHRDIPLDDTTA
ncbi:hypothetical protein BU16DRAFT_302989 [Lophium mytilinum]|uniref:Uncharacterized protein n=1 Tax=Lophium mytilinum TaxID=390894 RepID=A0A6A6R5F5_9PEZI|nr:hypothetical protein BU16DRAFT_302989 [Lophium mytilinum]